MPLFIRVSNRRTLPRKYYLENAKRSPPYQGGKSPDVDVTIVR